MADKNILEVYAAKPTTTPVGKIFYCGNPTSVDDESITYENLVAPITSVIHTRVSDTGKSASYTKVFPALSKLKGFDIYVTAGTPSIKIGTTAGGTDILPLTAITDIELFTIPYPFKISTTLYITISGGTVSINFEYYANIF